MEICKKTLQSHPQIGVIENAPMADYTSFRIGGPAELLVTPETEEALLFCLRVLKDRNVPYTLMGAGSNMLVSDKGIPGAVVRFAQPYSRMRIQGSCVTAEAGISLASLAASCGRAGLSGLEALSGIPGSLGGALYMNAGAYGGEIKDVVSSVRALNADGELCTIDRRDCCFGYRSSIFSRVGFVALSAELQLSPKNPDLIREDMLEYNRRRKEKQPLSYPSAGSFFKRPEGHFAGKLIEDAGLKGFSVGDAEISDKHAGFVVNKGSATAMDVYHLMEAVQEKVYDMFGVHLEPEVQFLGDFTE